MVTDLDGRITQNVVYIPYGEVFVEERNGSWASPYLFNAKELDEETGLYYYGARYLDPTTAVWLSVDPKWEDYSLMTPYNYCAGNPVKLVDPDGREIENIKVWNKEKKNINKRVSKLQKQLDKGKIREADLENTKDRINILNNVLSNMELMEKSPQKYYLDPDFVSPSEYYEGGIKYDNKTGRIKISYSGSTSNFIHELIHCFQYETGDIGFHSNGNLLAQDIYDEVSAYKAQFAFLSCFGTETVNVKDVNEKWIYDKMPDLYKPGGDNKTGTLKITIGSTSKDIRKAYNIRELEEGGFLKKIRKRFYI